MSGKIKGVMRGRFIELDEDSRLPEGQAVSVEIESIDSAENWLSRIVLDPGTNPGQAIIKGTRIAAEELARLLAEGTGEQDLLRTYPALSAADIEAVRQFAKVPAGLRHAFGGWADDAQDLDAFLDWNRGQRQQAHRDPDE